MERRRNHQWDKDKRISRQRRELKRLNLSYLAQYGRANRYAREAKLLSIKYRNKSNAEAGLMSTIGKYDLAVAHGRQALGPKARAKFDAEYNRIMKGETDEQE